MTPAERALLLEVAKYCKDTAAANFYPTYAYQIGHLIAAVEAEQGPNEDPLQKEARDSYEVVERLLTGYAPFTPIRVTSGVERLGVQAKNCGTCRFLNEPADGHCDSSGCLDSCGHPGWHPRPDPSERGTDTSRSYEEEAEECPECSGLGYDYQEDHKCPNCNGTGKKEKV